MELKKIVQADEERTFEYLIAAGWSEGAVNRTAAEFQDYTLRVAEEFNAPLKLVRSKLETKRSGAQ